jgi:hypothetical protein
MKKAIGVGLACGAAALLAFAAAQAEDVTFSFVPPAGSGIESVSVRGSFNGWNETPMELTADGTWSVTIDLPHGEHQYKYFLNGEWPGDMESGLEGRPVDTEADGYAPDGYGGRNAVRVVGSSRPMGEGRQYGYRMEGDEIVFELDLADCEAITTSDGKRVGIDDISISIVAVAGEFNGWSTAAWPMRSVGSGSYELRRQREDFEQRPVWLFKFVADDLNWLEPPSNATNMSSVGSSTFSHNLVLYLDDDLGLLRQLVLPGSKQSDVCRLKPISHGRGASIIPMSSNPMVTADPDVIAMLMMFVVPPTAEEEAGYEEEMKTLPPERAQGRIQEIMRERAAQVRAAYAAVYQASAGGPETGTYALLYEEPIPESDRARLEQEGLSGFVLCRGRVAVMAWADGSDRSCLSAVRAHVVDVLSE